MSQVPSELTAPLSAPGMPSPEALLPAALVLVALVAWPSRSRASAQAALAVLAVHGRSIVGTSPRPWAWPVGLRRRSSARLDVLPLLDALASGLRAGLTPQESLAMAARGSAEEPIAALVAPVLEAAEQGRPLGGAWERAARLHAHPDLSSLARAWMVSERLGCPLADAAATTAQTSRARAALAQRLDAATAGARATATLLSLLPLGGMGIALMLGIDPVTLYGSPFALLSVTAGLALLGGGRWVVGRMIGAVEGGLR